MIRAARTLAAALVALACSGALAEECASRDSGATPLLNLAPMEMVVFPPGLGTRVGFQGQGELVSYFRFDYGLVRITDADDAEARAGAIEDMGTKADLYGMAADRPVDLDPVTSGGIDFAVVQVRMLNDEAVALEYLAHGHDGGCFHKVRYTILMRASPSPALLVLGNDRFREVMAALGPFIAD